MATTNPPLSFHDRALGMLLGLHAGDSLGAPLEFHPARPREAWATEITGGGDFKWRPGAATDDTDLTLAVLRSISARNQFSVGRLKEELLRWYESKPVDIGNTTKRSLARLHEGVPIEESGVGGQDTQTNGSLMRCAPLALLSLRDEELRPIVKLQTASTHAHPRCVLSDWILVSALRKLLAGGTRHEAYLCALGIAKEDPAVHEALAKVPTIPWEDLATGGNVVETLTAGFWGLLRAETLEDALVQVVNRGADSDTCAAVTGALWGAHAGSSAIPARWLEKLERADELCSLLAARIG